LRRRKPGSEDRSFRHYFDVVTNFLTHFDSKGYRSLWYLLTRPGFLSLEYLRGSKVRYAKPLSLFISLNIVYYFFISLSLCWVSIRSRPRFPSSSI
jgi:uncharacterized protein DUF3667